MARTTREMVIEFYRHWKNYLIQPLLATVMIFFVLLGLTLQEAVIVASIGASTFIIFALPNHFTSNPRNLVGGHILGILCGSLSSMLLHHMGISNWVVCSLLYSVAVGLSIFLMVVTDTEHPPASGTALGVATQGFSWRVSINLVLIVIALSLIHRFFKRYLRDLR